MQECRQLSSSVDCPSLCSLCMAESAQSASVAANDASGAGPADALLPATGVSAESPVALLPAEAVFPFGAHKGSTIAHVASLDRQHLAYFAGNYANYKRQKWLENTHPEFYLLLACFAQVRRHGATGTRRQSWCTTQDTRRRSSACLRTRTHTKGREKQMHRMQKGAGGSCKTNCVGARVDSRRLWDNGDSE